MVRWHGELQSRPISISRRTWNQQKWENVERLRRQNLEFLSARTCGLVEQVVSLICWLEIPANVPLTSSMDREYFPSPVFFFCDLEGARGFIRGMSSYKLYIFSFKKYFRKLMMHMLLSMSAKYCAEKKAFCSNTLGGPFIPIWHLLAIPNNTKWIHSPFCLLWSSSWEKWELRQTWRFSHFECISAANLIRIAIFYLNHEFQKYLGNEFLLLKKSKVDQTMEQDFPTYQVLKSQKFDVEFPIGNKGRGTMSPGWVILNFATHSGEP